MVALRKGSAFSAEPERVVVLVLVPLPLVLVLVMVTPFLVRLRLFVFVPPEVDFVRLTGIDDILCQQITMNYLKYWRVVRYFINAKYGISQPDLEMLIFLYDEPYFTRAKFKEFNKVFSWDKNRFNRLIQNGWIEKVSVESKSRLGVYNLTYQAKRIIGYVYSLLNGTEFPMEERNNPVFKRNVSYNDKVYRNVMMEINEVQRQHRAQR